MGGENRFHAANRITREGRTHRLNEEQKLKETGTGVQLLSNRHDI